VVVASDLNKNIGRSMDLAKKKGTDRQIYIPLSTPLMKTEGNVLIQE